MFRKFAVVVIAILAFAAICNVLCQAQALPALTHHVREVTLTGEAPLVGQLPADQSLLFDVMLPLRDRAGLQSLIQELYDPTSASYHKFITPEEVTERFGPSQADWDTLVAFARASGFDVLGGTRDSRDLWLRGTVADIQKAFHVTMNVYQEPTEEGRTFFAVDREPTTNLPFPLWHITGLDNDSKPHPLYVKKGDYAKAHGVSPESIVSNITGSGPSNNFLGSDMRAAYYQGTALTGSGQNIGLFELAGTDLADLTTYYTNVKQTEPYTPTLVSTGGYATTCTYSGGRSKECDDTEQTIDLTQAMGMAPGSTMLYMYVCGNVLASGSGNFSDSACISAMVTTTAAPLSKQISCSWGWTPADNTTLDPYFEQMASQGQNFFAASGDSSTWSSSNEAWPADDVNVVAVGGTDLTTSSAGGPWSSETAWSDSGGGISPDKFAIPTWQQISGVINSSNKGSTTYRNGPDVSANGNFSFYYCADQEGCGTGLGGTSFAAPMWAGYLALVNQQAAANGELIGFINPTIYEQAALGGTTYSTLFHDITSGTSGSYSAETGYDLVTGWGSPNTTGLINLLAPASSLATTTALSSTLNPSAYGQAVTFTAKVTASSGTPTGTVQFSIDGSSFGSPVTLVSGSATSGSTSTLTEGTHTVTAAYSGATGFLTSNGTLSGGQVVNAATAATVVTSTVNPSVYGQSVTLIATISGQYGLLKGGQRGQAVTGTVAWSANTGCGTTNVTSGTPGVATCTTSSLAVGNDAITATYSGDGNHSGGTGTLSGGQVVNAATSATTVASTLNPSAYGQAVSFSANVAAIAPGAGTPTGTVQFSIDGSSFGSPVTLVSGSATSSSISTLTEGTHTVTAAYSGSTNFLTSNGTLSGGQTVNAATAATVVTSTVNPSVYGQQVTLTATISGQYGLLKKRSGARGQDVTGTVTWSANTGCGTTSVTSGNPGVATCTTSSLIVGNNAITATYSGDGNHSGGAGTLSGGQTVNPASTSIAVTGVSPSNEDYGLDSPVTITAQLSWTGSGTAPTAGNVTIGGNGPSSYGATSCGPVSGNTITCTNTYTPTVADAADGYTETAAFSADSNYSASSSPQTNNFTINSATSSTVVTSGLSPSTYGQSVTFTATISGENGLTKGRTRNGRVKPQDVTGTVAWSANTGCGTTSVTAGNPGAATCTTSSLAGGGDSVVASYSGDVNHGTSSGTFSQTVNPASQAITFNTNAPASATYNTNFTVAATGGASGNPVTFTSSGSCSNSGATYTMTSGTGSCSVIANQTGNGNYSAAPPATETVSAAKASQTVNFTTNAPASANNGSSFTVAASATSSLAVSYTSAGVCSNVGATYTMTSGSGTCSVIASQTGNDNYAAASPVTEMVNATGLLPQTITFTTPAPNTAKSGDSFTVAAVGGASGNPVTFSAGAGSVCALSGATYTMTSNTGFCYVVANQAGNGTYAAAPQVTETVTAVKTVVKVAPTVTFTGAPSSASYLSTFTVATTQNSGVSPTITSTTGSVCTVSGNVVTMKNGTGTCTVKASWAANDYYLAATLEQSTAATQLATTTAITNTIPEKNPLKVTVYFTASNGTSTATAGTVQVTAASGQSCSGTVSSGKCVLTFPSAESTTVTASYEGNTDNAGSSSAPYPLTVN